MPDASQAATAVPVYAQFIVAAAPVLGAVIPPIVAWVLGRSGVSKDSATIDYFSKRLDFIERMGKLQAQFAEGPMKPVVDTEIENCREFLRQAPTFLGHRDVLRPPVDSKSASGPAVAFVDRALYTTLFAAGVVLFVGGILLLLLSGILFLLDYPVPKFLLYSGITYIGTVLIFYPFRRKLPGSSELR